MPSKSPAQRLRDILENIRVHSRDGFRRFRFQPQNDIRRHPRSEIISEASRRLPDDVKARHSALDWPAIAAAGNIYRHEYETVDDALIWHTVKRSGKYAMAEMLLERGADPNARVYASGDPVFQAYSQRDSEMVKLLERYGGVANATTAGLYRQTELARKMLAGEAQYRLDGVGGDTLAEQLLWGAACGGDAGIVRMALERVAWPRDDPRWFTALEQPLRIWTHGSGGKDWDRGTYLTCFRLVLERCDPNLRGRPQDHGQFGLTILHSVAGSREHVTAEERAAFATMLLDAGARVDIRDNLLLSTPLGWACRWGRLELVKLLLERGADPLEADAPPWATPRAWADRMGHNEVLALLGAC